MVLYVGAVPTPKAIETPPRRIFVKQVNWLGDLVMSQPALRALRRAYPDAHLTVCVRADLAGFFAAATWLDEILPYRIEAGWPGVRSQLDLVRALRRHRFDLAVLFPDSFRSAVWATAAGIPRRVGFARNARSWMLTDAVARTPATLSGHQVDYRLHLLRSALGVAGNAGDHAIDVAPAAQERMQHWLAGHRRRPASPLVAVAPGAAYGPAKQWPAASFAALIDLLAAADGTEAVLVGSPTERALCEAISSASRHGALVAAGATDVAELIALLSSCAGFAGNDSGAMHVAGALGVATIGIFGSTRPDRTAPLGPRATVVYRGIDCSPCLDRRCRFGHTRCLTEISPEEVAAALRRQMSL